jgi:hypothetical protein
MLQLILFATVEQDQSFIGSAADGLKLIRLFRIVHLFFRKFRIFESRRILYPK